MLSSIKEEEQHNTPTQADSGILLWEAGVKPLTLCDELAAAYPPERIAEVIEHACKEARSKGAYIVSALRGGWTWEPGEKHRSNEDWQAAAGKERQQAKWRLARILKEREEANRLAEDRQAARRRTQG